MFLNFIFHELPVRHININQNAILGSTVHNLIADCPMEEKNEEDGLRL